MLYISKLDEMVTMVKMVNLDRMVIMIVMIIMVVMVTKFIIVKIIIRDKMVITVEIDGHGLDDHHGRGDNHGRGQTGQTKLILKLDFPDNLCWAAFAIFEVFQCYGHFALNDLQYPNFAFKVIIARFRKP